ncbi:hypothetical protein Q8A67_003274 [Cirrhinus molitorella]|uniref:Uncharacterized protein n=1 Tax=Cirrhinus molitorella TaxID=172907 RepID=A0AA88QE97_9TELE|nr:hypothetical protein Q8A67_003274 [Cirrhinus molitorella]
MSRAEERAAPQQNVQQQWGLELRGGGSTGSSCPPGAKLWFQRCVRNRYAVLLSTWVDGGFGGGVGGVADVRRRENRLNPINRLYCSASEHQKGTRVLVTFRKNVAINSVTTLLRW